MVANFFVRRVPLFDFSTEETGENGLSRTLDEREA
jgi:hypothetical protein